MCFIIVKKSWSMCFIIVKKSYFILLTLSSSEDMIVHLTGILPMTFFLNMSSAFTSAAKIHLHFRKLLIIELNTMNPDQTAPMGAV